MGERSELIIALLCFLGCVPSLPAAATTTRRLHFGGVNEKHGNHNRCPATTIHSDATIGLEREAEQKSQCHNKNVTLSMKTYLKD